MTTSLILFVDDAFDVLQKLAGSLRARYKLFPSLYYRLNMKGTYNHDDHLLILESTNCL